MRRTGERRLWLRLLLDARPFWGQLGLVLLVNLLAAPLALLAPIPLKLAVDNALSGKPLPSWLGTPSPTALIVGAAMLSALILLVQALQSYGVWVYQLYVGERIVLHHRVGVFWHVLRLSLRRHDRIGAADLQYRVQTDVFNMHYMTIYGLIPWFTGMATFAVMLAITWHLDWQLGALAAAALPLLWLIGKVHVPQSRRMWGLQKETEQRAVAVLQETLAAVRTVKAFDVAQRTAQRYQERAQRSLVQQIRTVGTEGAFGVAVSGVVAIVSALTLGFGALHVHSGTLSLGSLLVLMAYQVQLLKSLETLSKQVSAVQSSLASAQRVYALMDEAPDIQDDLEPVSVDRSRGAIEFKQVSFAYRNNDKTLDRVNLSVTPGQRIGIVGPTGSGKSTLIQLLLRFYDPASGSITLDGIDLRRYKVSDLRRQFAVVLQDPVLFSGTIAENIAYGVPEATPGAIERAARAAGAHDFIVDQPDGYHTEVGERGVCLSGGERQRIAIARAFLLDAPILVLDEPTSAVDRSRQDAIAASLERLQRGRTTFTISHRPELLEGYDRVLTLDSGHLSVPLSFKPRWGRKPSRVA